MCFIKTKKVEFDMFEKIDVNGENAHPLWKFLKHKQGGTLGEYVKTIIRYFLRYNVNVFFYSLCQSSSFTKFIRLYEI